MIPSELLEASLLDLLYELKATDLRLTLGGGYGLALKHRHLRSTSERTLLAAFPDARSTNDLDLFLRTEIIADAHRTRLLAEALQRLGCRPVPSAQYYQFIRAVPVLDGTGEVKFDILTGPCHPSVDASRIRADPRRWRPRGPKVALHARYTPEAVAIEEDLVQIPLHGRRTTGEHHEATIFLPQPFTYALMKLHAFRDRHNDPDKNLGRHHALDLYMIIAMATEPEWATAMRLSRAYRDDAAVREAGSIVTQHFVHPEAMGAVRLREHPQFSAALDLAGFMSALAELFPAE